MSTSYLDFNWVKEFCITFVCILPNVIILKMGYVYGVREYAMNLRQNTVRH